MTTLLYWRRCQGCAPFKIVSSLEHSLVGCACSNSILRVNLERFGLIQRSNETQEGNDRSGGNRFKMLHETFTPRVSLRQCLSVRMNENPRTRPLTRATRIFGANGGGERSTPLSRHSERWCFSKNNHLWPLGITLPVIMDSWKIQHTFIQIMPKFSDLPGDDRAQSDPELHQGQRG